MSMKRILITGCNGFVARHFVNFLQEHEAAAELYGIDLDPVRSLLRVEYASINLLDRDAIESLIVRIRPTHIAHFASVSSVSESWINPVNSFVNNTNIFLNIAEIIRRERMETRILSIGSSEEYGDYPPELMPIRESYELRPNSPYAIARVAQEMLSKLYAEKYGLNIVMTRSFNHIGPGQRITFAIPSFVRQIVMAKRLGQSSISVGNVEVVRDFLDVRDVAEAYHKILFIGDKGAVYNVSSGEGYRLQDILSMIFALVDFYPSCNIDFDKIRKSDSRIVIGDSSKLRNELGWCPKIPLIASLEDMINECGRQLTEV